MNESDSNKEMSQAFVEQFEVAVDPTVQKIKNWNGDPAKLNDLKTSVKADLQSVMADLDRKLNDGYIDSEKLIEVIARSSTSRSVEDTRAWAFLMEILLMTMMEKNKERGLSK